MFAFEPPPRQSARPPLRPWDGGQMHIGRIGFTPIKGGRHVEHASVELALDGPVGDREFAVVDLSRLQVLRTIENPGLLACSATWAGGVLSVDLDGLAVAAVPQPTGDEFRVEYWGRPALVEIADGPWATAFSARLGREVVLARAVRSGDFVYGAPVSIVTTGALRLLAESTANEVDPARFRATFVIDTDGLSPHVEDSWAGRELRLGTVTLRVLGAIDRCAVIDADPRTGESDARLLRTLTGYRLRDGSIDFGMFAEVVMPGRVSRGDPVTLEPA
jgi:uncharacterized protein YcbX